jgi:hypothetical protein
MKLKLLVAILSLSATTAFARANLTRNHVNLIKSQELTDSVRVYLNKRLMSYYTMGSDQSIDADSGDISVRTVVENLEVKVTKKVRGLITGILASNERIFVSFDADCLSTECSYVFDLRNGKYDLTDVPKLNGYTLMTAKSGVIFKGKPLKKERIHLEINNESLNIINTQRINSTGH